MRKKKSKKNFKKPHRDGNYFLLKDVFILVDKSLLMLLADNTKMLANTGNRSGKLQRWVNHTEQSEMFGKQKITGLNSQKAMNAPGTRDWGPFYRTRAVSAGQQFRIEITDCCWLVWVKFRSKLHFLCQGNDHCSIWIKMSLKLALLSVRK